MAEIGTDLDKAIHFLQSGDLVGIPTETVYGLAGNALQESSVLKIFEVKNRPQFDPLIVHSHSLEGIIPYVETLEEEAIQLAEVFWPGPLTLLLPKNDLIPDLVTSGSRLAGFRVPAHGLTRLLLQELEFPLAAPSANPFGYISPTEAQHVEKQLGQKIPYIVDGGPCSVGVESTIIGWEAGELQVFRLGGISLEQIEEVVKKKIGKVHQSSSKPAAPGMLMSHYAPRTPLYRVDKAPIEFDPGRYGYISFGEKPSWAEACIEFPLSKDGDLKEAAVRLFHTLRIADEARLTGLFVNFVPEVGIGRAINDRLRRASQTWTD